MHLQESQDDEVKGHWFLGLGNMGCWMATNLAEKVPVNCKIYLFDIVPAPVYDICGEHPDKVMGCSDPKDVASKSVCILEPVLFCCFSKETNAI